MDIEIVYVDGQHGFHKRFRFRARSKQVCGYWPDAEWICDPLVRYRTVGQRRKAWGVCY